jgi:outer membrane lipoprotein carrier protein
MLAMCVPHAHSQSNVTVQDLTEKMQRRYEMVDDATAEFTQVVKFGFSSIEQRFQGTLKMKKPSKYRIESEHQTLVTDGSTVWSYSPVNNQVLIDRYRENQNSLSPEKFLLNIPSAYYATFLGKEKVDEKPHLVLKLVPKDDRSFVKSAKIWVEEGTWIVGKVTMVDVNETETTYLVKSVKLNTNIQESTFSFKPPTGSEIVDLRR